MQAEAHKSDVNQTLVRPEIPFLEFTNSSSLAARFNAMISTSAVFRPSDVQQLLDPGAGVTLPALGDGQQRVPNLPMLQAVALYLHSAAQVTDDAQAVFAAAETGFSGRPIEAHFARTGIGREPEVIDTETGTPYVRSCEDAITEAVYGTLLTIEPHAAMK